MELPLQGGMVGLIDSADWPTISHIHWFASQSGGRKWYVRGYLPGTRQMVLLHRFLLQPPQGTVTDHVNDNGLDNRRANLRVVSQSANIRRQARKPTVTAPYKGVFRRSANRWIAQILAPIGRQYLGTFETAEQAARAYDTAARQWFGKYARPNFTDM